MEILTLVDHFLPGFRAGGPIRTLANMVAQLGDRLSFRIVTRDRDLGDSTPYPGIEPGAWCQVGNAQVLYLPPEQCTVLGIRTTIRSIPHDVLYLNSFFSRPFSVIPLALREFGLLPRSPVVLAPRGEFSAGALQLKRRRKRAYIEAARASACRKHLVWQASSPFEQQDIRSWFGRDAHVLVAPDLPAAGGPLPTSDPPGRKRSGTLRVLFLARVSRMKNLDGALRALTAVRGEVEFNIFGPLEDEAYWDECRQLMDRLPSSIRVGYHGAVAHDRVASIVADHDLLLLPTNGENFGHSILESLLGGRPVLISDRTPWRNLEREGAGWDLPLSDPDAFRGVLQRCVDMSASEFQQWCEGAARLGRERSGDEVVLRQNLELFRIAAGESAAPC